MKLHDRLVKDVVFGLDISSLLIHALSLKLGLLQRGLEHDFLLVELLLLGLELFLAGFKEFDLLLALVQLVSKVFGSLLLFLGLVSDARNLGLNLEDLVVSLLDQLLDGLKGLVSLLHAKETLLPVFKKGFLAHNDTFDLDGGLLECVTGSSGFFLLGDELSLVQCLLLVKALDLLIHGIDE